MLQKKEKVDFLSTQGKIVLECQLEEGEDISAETIAAT